MGKKKKQKPLLQQSSDIYKKATAEIKPMEKPPLPLWLRYLRTFGIISSSLSGGILMPEHFWLGVGFIYLTAILLVLDFCFEPELKRHPTIKDLLILLIIVASLIFTFKVVLGPAPLEVVALDYGAGTPDEENGKIGDVRWKSDYHDIRIYVTNRTDDDYTNLIIGVETDLHIAHVGRFGKCLDGSVEQGIQMGPVVTGSPSGEQIYTNVEGPVNIPVPGGYTMTSFGSYSPNWKIQCDKIRRNDSIEFLLAVVHLDEEKGFKLLSPQKPAWVAVNIDYESMGHRHRKLKKKIEMPSLHDNRKLSTFSYKFFKFHFGGIK
jgi:hypothetical protein